MPGILGLLGGVTDGSKGRYLVALIGALADEKKLITGSNWMP